jgi:hypothetical protein
MVGLAAPGPRRAARLQRKPMPRANPPKGRAGSFLGRLPLDRALAAQARPAMKSQADDPSRPLKRPAPEAELRRDDGGPAQCMEHAACRAPCPGCPTRVAFVLPPKWRVCGARRARASLVQGAERALSPATRRSNCGQLCGEPRPDLQFKTTVWRLRWRASSAGQPAACPELAGLGRSYWLDAVPQPLQDETEMGALQPDAGREQPAGDADRNAEDFAPRETKPTRGQPVLDFTADLPGSNGSS